MQCRINKIRRLYEELVRWQVDRLKVAVMDRLLEVV